MNPETSVSPQPNLTIKHWPSAERPRERLLEAGATVLSDAELLAVLIRNGSAGKDAVSLAREILTASGGLRGLLSCQSSQLMNTKGIGPAKAAMLLASAELGKRYLKAGTVDKCIIREPQAVIDYLMASLRDKAREVFKVLFVNKANRIIGEEDLFLGTVDEAAVHPREIVGRALEYRATAVVLVHNHPSGRSEPSPEDKEITWKIKTACATVAIKVLDHIIIGDNRYFSFNEQGLLP